MVTLSRGEKQRKARNGTKNLNPDELQQWRAFPVASPDDVQMINVCKITAISQTLCILPSVPAHFLQLLRDACGSLLKTTRPNFKHFLPTLPHFSDPQCLRLPSVVRRDSSEPCGSSLFTESSILDSLRRSRSISGVFFFGGGEPIGRSSMTVASLLREMEPFSLSLPQLLRVLVCDARGAPPARLRRNFERGRTQSAAKSAQTDRRGGGCSA